MSICMRANMVCNNNKVLLFTIYHNIRINWLFTYFQSILCVCVCVFVWASVPQEVSIIQLA